MGTEDKPKAGKVEAEPKPEPSKDTPTKPYPESVKTFKQTVRNPDTGELE